MPDAAAAESVAERVSRAVAERGPRAVAHADTLTDLVVGGSGLVGGALVRRLGPRATGTYRTRPLPGLRALDARDADAVRRLLEETHPARVFFPAADPNVDWCEAHPDDARAANVAPALAALAACRASRARFVFFSSDYVFDGAAGPYAEDDVVRPLSVYGRHKREVEEAVLAAGGTVIRTTTVYGMEQPPGKNFVLRVVARLRAGERVTAPNDQYATPTWSDELAAGADTVGALGGVWHVAGPELLARDAFARLVARAFALDGSLVEGVPTASLRQVAPRPLRGGLRTEKLRGRLGRAPLSTAESLVKLRAQLT